MGWWKRRKISKGLQGEDDQERAWALRAAAEEDDPRAAEYAESALRAPSPAVRDAAVDVIESWAGPGRVEMLLGALGMLPPGESLSRVLSLVQAQAAAGWRPETYKTKELLVIAATREDADPTLVALMEQLGAEDFPRLLAKLITTETGIDLKVYARLLPMLRQPGAVIEVLAAYLDPEDPRDLDQTRRQELAVQALGALVDDHSLDILLARLSNPGEEVRALVCDALGWAGRRMGRQDLVQIAGAEGDICLMGSCAHPAGRAALLELLELGGRPAGLYPADRLAAARALGGHPTAVAALLELMGDDWRELDVEACDALEAVGAEHPQLQVPACVSCKDAADLERTDDPLALQVVLGKLRRDRAGMEAFLEQAASQVPSGVLSQLAAMEDYYETVGKKHFMGYDDGVPRYSNNEFREDLSQVRELASAELGRRDLSPALDSYQQMLRRGEAPAVDSDHLVVREGEGAVCGFCREQVHRWICLATGGGARLCEVCAGLVVDLLRSYADGEPRVPDRSGRRRCSYCDGTEADAGPVIAGPGENHICSRCGWAAAALLSP